MRSIAFGRVGRQPRGNAPLDQSRTGLDRVGGVQRGRIVVTHGRGDAALRPGRRRQFAERAIRNERDRSGRSSKAVSMPARPPPTTTAS
jgi:hypothetical protein